VKAVLRNQLLPLEQYERLRPLLRPLLIAEKDRRRLEMGDHLTLLFENTQTVWYQVQEMLRSEHIADEPGIEHELDTYNELLPGPNELSATLLLHFREPATRDVALRKLVGLERHLWLINGDRRQQARFDQRQFTTERISSVHFVRFPVGGLDSEEFRSRARQGLLAIETTHPELPLRVPLGGQLAEALAGDLA